MTIIQNMARNNHIEIRPDVCSPEDLVYINDTKTKSSFGGYGISVLREEFASAVRDLGFVVIDEKELPEVVVDGNWATIADGTEMPTKGDVTPGDMRGAARSYLALAAYLEANPPVDPKVEALADLLESEMVPIRDERFTDLAGRLLATGRIQVTE